MPLILCSNLRRSKSGAGERFELGTGWRDAGAGVEFGTGRGSEHN